MSLNESLTAYLGQLLGPRPTQEIVITRYEDNRINYQIEGMTGPVPPEDSYTLLSIVASQIAPHLHAPQGAPQAVPQEAPQTHE